MKWSFVIQQKLKAAFLLTGIMALVVLCSFLSKSTIKDIDQSFSSIYQDRLVPAVDMVYLSENLYTKRLLLERYLYTQSDLSPAQVAKQLGKQNRSIDSLLRNFEKTVLVDEEAKSLVVFKNRVKAYADQEKAILRLNGTSQKVAGSELFNGQAAITFQQAIKALNELTNIQTAVGQNLVKASKHESSQFNLLSSLQIIIAIVIGLLILGLIHNSKIITQDRQPFHLN